MPAVRKNVPISLRVSTAKDQNDVSTWFLMTFRRSSNDAAEVEPDIFLKLSELSSVLGKF
jgi:hypothetical protein